MSDKEKDNNDFPEFKGKPDVKEDDLQFLK